MSFQSVIEWVLAGLATWGYPIVFLVTAGENIFVLGSFVPGDVVTAAAAVAAATNPAARLTPWALIALGTFGSLLGANVSYVIGRRGGRDLIERVGPRFGMDIQAIEAAEEFFEKRGAATVFLGRFVAVVKNIVPALAGASKMNIFWFELYSLLSAAVYACVLVGVGWFLGDNFQRGLKVFGAFSWLMLMAVVIAAIAMVMAKRKADKRIIAKNAAVFEELHPDEAEEIAEASERAKEERAARRAARRAHGKDVGRDDDPAGDGPEVVSGDAGGSADAHAKVSPEDDGE
jgi:membrane protein DedA with SNARE-associated domain